MNLPSFPNIDLFSAGINALNGVLVARNPSRNGGYAVAGLLIMTCFGGIGGGVARDLLLNDIPSPIKDPKYIVVCILMGLLGLAIYRYVESKEERFCYRRLLTRPSMKRNYTKSGPEHTSRTSSLTGDVATLPVRRHPEKSMST